VGEDKEVIYLAILLSTVLLVPVSTLAQQTSAPAANPTAANMPVVTAPESDGAARSSDGSASDTIPPGTKITMENWQKYQQFLPDGMVALFQGRYFWKMPSDVSMEVGPTVIHPLPRNYLAATEKYSGQVKVVELPDGGLSLANYRGGLPFPNPQEPHKGWKVLADVWFRYLPRLMVDSYGYGCGVNSMGGQNCFGYTYVTRQFAYNTDASPDPAPPQPGDKYYTEWFMMIEPEQDKYTTTLSIDYADPTRPEDLYLFVPSLRRYQPVSTAARCAPSQGLDATPEDYHFGLDTNITQMKVDYVGRRKMLTLMDVNLPTGRFPDGYDMPLGWPTPSWGKWQVRDVDVISMSKVPSQAGGYCYGKRVMYVDAQYYGPLWEELYDSNMRIWKYEAIITHSLDLPGIGIVDSTGSFAQLIWDVQNNHATYSSDPAMGKPFYVNEQVPKEFNDIPRYSSASGLNLIMR
jgi:Protein of unknown function (DUF1329)